MHLLNAVIGAWNKVIVLLALQYNIRLQFHFFVYLGLEPLCFVQLTTHINEGKQITGQVRRQILISIMSRLMRHQIK
jgi:hypothetical protein